MNERSRLALVLRALVACVALAGIGTATAAAEKRIQFNIAPQDLLTALTQFARQSDQELLFSTDVATSKRTSGVTGEFAPTEALRALLQGTGLEYRVTSENTILIERMEAESEGRAGKAGAALGTSLLLAQQAGERPPSASPAGSTPAGRTSPDSDAARRSLEILEEVIVTGSFIRGVVPAGSPLTTYTREDIDVTGAATLAQFARYMPQNFASVDATSVRTTSSGGFPQGGENSSLGAGFNLHGFGPAATLTLLNGRRLAPGGLNGQFVDVSMIPLAAVERIDVLADGASALYGADAIAGVVNVILRDDFEGAQTNLRYGATADGGAEQFTGSQLLGTAWQTGGAMLVYEYDGHQELYADERDFVPPQPAPDMLSPKQSRNSFLVTGHQSLGQSTSISLDAYYSDRNARLETSTFGVRSLVETGGENYGGTLGVIQDLPGTWRLDVSGTASRLEQPSFTVLPAFNLVAINPVETELASAALRADGPLFSLRAGNVRAALGADFRSEKLETESTTIFAGVGSTVTQELSRDVWSVVGELFVPIIGDTTAVPGVERLEVSIAGRHDHYDDVGSSTNPKVGVLWSPTPGLNLRASYGTSFRAPLLTQLTDAPVYFGFRLADPAAASGFTNTIFIDGNGRVGLEPETSRSLTIGFDIAPTALPGLQITGTYFDLDFTDRVARPPLVRGRQAIFLEMATLEPFFDLSPDPAEVQAIFTGTRPFINVAGLTLDTVEALFDGRPDNMAETRMTGIDAAVSYDWTTAAGSFGLRLSGSHILTNDIQPVLTVPSVSLNDKLGSPVDLRLNAGLTWSHAGFGSSLIVNYWDGYSNPLATPQQEIESWATVDLQLRYGAPETGIPPALRGLAVALTVQNVTNERPPEILLPATLFSHGYDPTNASAMGRVIALQLTKSW